MDDDAYVATGDGPNDVDDVYSSYGDRENSGCDKVNNCGNGDVNAARDDANTTTIVALIFLCEKRKQPTTDNINTK